MASASAGPSPGRTPDSSGPFADGFERAELGADYHATSARWRINAGRLCGEEARNRPVWLQRRLPVNVHIEFDAQSFSPEGDIKVEVFGDGRSFAASNSYSDATSYLLIFGGWKNSRHVLARLDEHAKGRSELLTRPGAAGREGRVVPARKYRFKIQRSDGQTLRWWVDGQEIHAFSDSEPLLGPGHEYFAFNTWQAHVCFDNLSVVPLGS